MNRRELFKGLAAALAAAHIPFPAEEHPAYGRSPLMDALPDLQYLNRLRADLLNRIIHPPLIIHEDGTLEQMPTTAVEEALGYVNKLLDVP